MAKHFIKFSKVSTQTARKTLIRSGAFPYHVTARCNNREKFPCGLEKAWSFLTSELCVQTILHDLKIHAFVLMPNHFHLLLTIPSGNLDLAMKGFMESTTKVINTYSRRSGHLYGGRYHWCLVGDPLYFAHALKYVLRNPLKANLAAKLEEYPFSTYFELIGARHPPLAVAWPSDQLMALVPSCPFEIKKWVEIPFSDKENKGIRSALRKSEFKLPIDRSTRRLLTIDYQK